MTNSTSRADADFSALLESELPRVMNEVLFALLGEPAPNPVLLNVPSKHHTPFGCRVCIRGSFEGEVIVSATLELANSVAARMFEGELSGPPTLRDARDALRELANIVAGNLKPLLAANSQLGLPEELAESVAARVPRARSEPLARATLEHRAGVLDVVVYTSL